jgi:hypothetical protein
VDGQGSTHHQAPEELGRPVKREDYGVVVAAVPLSEVGADPSPSCELVEVVSGSADGAVVVDPEEVSEGVADADVDSPSTEGVEVDEIKGGAFEMYAPFDSNAYWPTSRSPLGVS